MHVAIIVWELTQGEHTTMHFTVQQVVLCQFHQELGLGEIFTLGRALRLDLHLGTIVCDEIGLVDNL